MVQDDISVTGMNVLEIMIYWGEEDFCQEFCLPGGDDLHLNWISAYYHQERAVFKIEGVFHEILLIAALQWTDPQYAYAVWS